MKLYYMPGASSFVPHTALEWIGEPYEAQAVGPDEIKSPQYLALNPVGSVPVLQDGETVLSQNTAIACYLDARYPDALLFGSQDVVEKAQALRWFAFFNADVHKAFLPLFAPPAYAQGDEALGAKIRENAVAQITAYLKIADAHLQQHEFFGKRVSLADVYLYVILMWAHMLGIGLGGFARLNDFYTRMEADKGIDAVRSRQGLK